MEATASPCPLVCRCLIVWVPSTTTCMTFGTVQICTTVGWNFDLLVFSMYIECRSFLILCTMVLLDCYISKATIKKQNTKIQTLWLLLDLDTVFSGPVCSHLMQWDQHLPYRDNVFPLVQPQIYLAGSTARSPSFVVNLFRSVVFELVFNLIFYYAELGKLIY